MNQLQVFENKLFKVSAKTEGEQILFDVEQVAKSLGFTQVKNNKEYIRWGTVNRYLEKYVSQQVGKGDLIPEPLVYKLAFKAQNDVAEKFQDWLAIEVIPSIRKHGAYMTPETIEQALLNPDTLIKLATNLKEEQQKRIAAEQTIKKQQPLVNFAETCMTSEKSLLVRELAKLCTKQGIVTGEKRLWQKLREWKLVFANKTEPYQEYVERGYFEISQGVKETSKGSFTWLTMRVKPKGQVYIINRLKKEIEQLKAVK